MKIYVSIPMEGKALDEVLPVIWNVRAEIREWGDTPIDSFFGDDPSFLKCNIHIFNLSRALNQMSKCDAVYMCKGWQDDRQCKIEQQIAREYGMEIYYE